MSYFMPDRSCEERIFTKTDSDDLLDLAWGEDTLSDGRPFRVEFWAQTGVSMMTYFFDATGMDTLTNADVIDLLDREGIVRWVGDQRTIALDQCDDCQGRPIWCVNVVIGEGLDTPIARDLRPKLQPYDRSAADPPS